MFMEEAKQKPCCAARLLVDKKSPSKSALSASIHSILRLTTLTLPPRLCATHFLDPGLSAEP